MKADKENFKYDSRTEKLIDRLTPREREVVKHVIVG